MYYLLYKKELPERGYVVTVIHDDEEFNRMMNVSYLTPLLMTKSLELARKMQDEYNKKEP